MRLANLLMAALVLTAGAAAARAEQTTWRFGNLHQIGGFRAATEGNPKLIDSPLGQAMQFDGVGDSVLIDGRPLVGASQFTIEAIFRPDGGKFAQRFMHIAEVTPLEGFDAKSIEGSGDQSPRFMFEVRVTDDRWVLDSFVKSPAGTKFFMIKEKSHPLGRWYAIAQTYDGKTYRTYVDGVLEGEGDVAFVPHGPGRTRVGARMNRVDYFKGAIALGRFTDRALPPTELLKAPHQSGD
jgi:hypothetical protein